ncbi:GNAT family N-acetyltransferase [Catellatospora sichuanensis]|uniref:GNAT family N-acetyltransferase n=1 Tax=Catellatospora sichuanensis TaxID=1969805 RepID=UPI0011825FB0|nr:GNAT family N-acetyltransferase [Catellatospora sichuanensis]
MSGLHTIDTGVLDDPAGAALSGPHAVFARRHGQAACYDPAVTPFAALPAGADTQAWDDLAALVGPDGRAVVIGDCPVPAGWQITWQDEVVQLVDATIAVADEPAAVPLGTADVPEMLDLVERTKPGPFLARTLEMGTYLGIRQDGRLVAMAGERMHPPGFTEISAVCTDPAYRGQGLATRLIRAVAAGVRRRGETPFLHAASDNTSAIRLYEAMGFAVRRQLTFTVVVAPS